VPYSKTLLGLNSFKHGDHLNLQFPLNGHKSITNGRVYDKCKLKLEH
jgi:hypothetical protein